MRARDLGITIGTLPTGPLNAITDVAGVRVGHTAPDAQRRPHQPALLGHHRGDRGAILNSLIAAETMVGRDRITFHATPHDRLVEVMRRYGRLG
jgi:L-aminopeptidase/D-esterase-like protein